MTDRGSTLIILSPGFPESESDTACLPFLQLYVKAINRNYPKLNVIILAFQYPYDKAHYSWHGNEVIAFNGQNEGKLKRLQVWWQAWQTLKKLKEQHHVIGLFSLWVTECALIGKRFGAANNIPHYTWICGQDAKKENKRYIKWIRPMGEYLIAMSDFLQKEFYENYRILPEKVIPLGVEPDSFPSPAIIRDIDILGVGALIPLKQYDVFIKIIQDLAKENPDIKAVIRGTGPEMEKLLNSIKEARLEKNLMIMGEMPYDEVLGLMQRARIFLHTSNYEGFGTVCLEALFAGAHVLSFTRPMESPIAHWRHAANYEEMLNTAKELLADKTLDHTPVCPYTMRDVSRQMMGLYGL